MIDYSPVKHVNPSENAVILVSIETEKGDTYI